MVSARVMVHELMGQQGLVRDVRMPDMSWYGTGRNIHRSSYATAISRCPVVIEQVWRSILAIVAVRIVCILRVRAHVSVVSRARNAVMGTTAIAIIRNFTRGLTPLVAVLAWLARCRQARQHKYSGKAQRAAQRTEGNRHGQLLKGRPEWVGVGRHSQRLRWDVVAGKPACKGKFRSSSRQNAS